MKKILITLLFLNAILTLSVAQEQVEFDVKQYTDYFYRLTVDRGGYTVTMAMFKGKDGVVLVDTGEEPWAEAFKAKILELGGENPTFIINTHAHRDHTGGNAVFGKEPIIIAHDKLPHRLKSDYLIWDHYPEETFPYLTFSDSLTLHFNDEEIKIIAIPGSHDDNDIIVWFKNSGIACLGDISFGTGFPTTDPNTSPQNYVGVLDRIINYLPKETIIISGHGPDVNMEELKVYQNMFVETIPIIQSALDNGHDMDYIINNKLLKDWESFGQEMVSTNDWIQFVVYDIENPDYRTKRSVHNEMHEIYLKSGVDSTINFYKRVKANCPDDYVLYDVDLYLPGSKLSEQGKELEAISFHEASLEVYNQGLFEIYDHFHLGKLYKNQGNLEKSKFHLEKTLELNPEIKTAQKLLEEINELN